MPVSLSADILDFNHSADKRIYRAALDAVAQVRRVRPVFIERLQRDERQSMLVASLGKPGLDLAADGLIRNWLLKKHSGLLVEFLDARHSMHEKGVVEELPKTVEDAALKAAVETLLSKHPHEAVSVYLHAFNSMNAESWSNLDVLLEGDARLRLKRDA